MQTINWAKEGMEGQGHFWKNSGRLISMKPRPRYQVSVYRTNGPLVFFNMFKKKKKLVCKIDLYSMQRVENLLTVNSRPDKEYEYIVFCDNQNENFFRHFSMILYNVAQTFGLFGSHPTCLWKRPINKNIIMRSLKSSWDIQKKRGGPDSCFG